MAAESPTHSQPESQNYSLRRDRPGLRAHAAGAVAAHVSATLSGQSDAPEMQYLLDHLEMVDPDRRGIILSLRDYLAEPSASDLPLILLAKEMELTILEVMAIALAAAVEDDMMIGRALARLQAPVGGSRPTLGLLSAALADMVFGGIKPIESLITGAAVQSGLLTLMNEGAPLPERAVKVALPLCLALSGHDGNWPGATIGMGDTPRVLLAPSVAAEAERQALAQMASSERAIVLRTGSAAEGKTVACTMAEAINMRAVFIGTDQTAGLGPWLTLRELMPVFCFDLAPGERKVLPALPYYWGPVVAMCGHDGSVGAASGTALSWPLPVPDRQEREQLWQVAVGHGELASGLARHHRHGSGRIAHLGRIARHHAILNGNPQPTREDIAAASWVTEGAGLDALAQPLRDAIPDDALIVTPNLRNELLTLLLRCSMRDSLADGLGASATARYRPGVRALFTGPSGTGKTLAAGWLATKLGLPMYRVDLASVTSKYIGETEKNLAQLLARAEQAEIVLLFDEADSLFGKRTEVKEANDRFANAQTNYLLQRIESFDGITVLTSNSRNRFDSAFSRRLDMIIDFAMPGPEERRSLWQSHLGARHRLAQQELNQLAATVDFSGGQIRNAVFTAAVIARAEDRLIEYPDIIQGLMSEYKKIARQMPAGLRQRA